MKLLFTTSNDNVPWGGTNLTILKGVEIGDNLIIGVNCLVVKSVPINSIIKLSLN